MKAKGILSVLTAAALILPVFGATWHVDDEADPPGYGTMEEPFATLQYAIDRAGPGDRILVDAGRYTGEGNKNLDFKGKPLLIESVYGPSHTLLDCEGVGRGLYFHSGETTNSIFSGFTICNANTQAVLIVDEESLKVWQYGEQGSGLFITSNSSPLIRDCHIVNNLSMTYKINEYQPLPFYGNLTSCACDGFGGGLYCENSSPVLDRCIVASNTAGLAGGGLYFTANSKPQLVDCIIQENTIHGNTTIEEVMLPLPNGGSVTYQRIISDGLGGGVYASNACLLLSNSLIADNKAPRGGGGLYLTHCDFVRMDHCSMSGNQATDNMTGGQGGGLYLGQVTTGEISFCSFTANQAGSINSVRKTIVPIPNGGSEQAITIYAPGSGGGIFAVQSKVRMIHSTANGNTAGLSGGGLFLSTNACLDMSNCVTSANIVLDTSTPGYGAGIAMISAQLDMTHGVLDSNKAREPQMWTTEIVPLPNDSYEHLLTTVCRGLGGAIWATDSSLNLSYSIMTSNTSAQGGALWTCCSTAVLAGVECATNLAVEQSQDRVLFEQIPLPDGRILAYTTTSGESCAGLGGAFFFDRSQIQLSSSRLNHNLAGEAGASIYLTNSGMTAVNCVIRANHCHPYSFNYSRTEQGLTTVLTNYQTSTGPGAVLQADGSAFEAINCTFTDNNTDRSNELYAVKGSSISLLNSIVWDDLIQGGESSTSTVAYSCMDGGHPGSGNFNQNPRLTQGFRLRSDSPCIDQGTATGAPPEDVDGESRWDNPAVTNSVSMVDIGADEFVDQDDDQIADAWEIQGFSNLTTIEAATDFDQDQLPDREEYELSANPHNRDSDADWMADGWEVQHGFNPTAALDGAGDEDGDLFSNAQEYIADSNPADAGSFFTVEQAHAGEGIVSLSWSGAVGRLYHVEASTNLQNWRVVRNQSGTGGFLQYDRAPLKPSETFRIGISLRN